MTTTQETMTDTASRGQDATISAMEIWADTVKKMFSMPTPDGKIPNAAEVVDNYVDNYFDFVEHMLATQREIIKKMTAVTTSAADKAASAGQSVTKDMQGAAKEMQEPAKNSATKKS